jgi:hypothetical protein
MIIDFAATCISDRNLDKSKNPRVQIIEIRGRSSDDESSGNIPVTKASYSSISIVTPLKGMSK